MTGCLNRFIPRGRADGAGLLARSLSRTLPRVCADAGGGGGWNIDITNIVYDNINFSIFAQDSGGYDVWLKPDGTKMYFMGDTNNTIYQYTLATPWDMSTASYDSVSFSVTQEGGQAAFYFKSDGTKFYVVGDTNNTVYQYTLATPWDLSTASYDGVSFSVLTQSSNPYGLFFSDDGTKLFVLDALTSLFQYTLLTPWDVSTASYDSVSFEILEDSNVLRGPFFNSTGDKAYIYGFANDAIYEYDLATPWDLSTISYNNVNFPTPPVAVITGFYFKQDDGRKLYTITNGAGGGVRQWSVPAA